MSNRSDPRAGADEAETTGSIATGSVQGAAAPRRGRRAMLLGAAAAGAAAAASVAGRAAPASAAATSPAPVLLGKANTETATTSISNAKGTALSATTATVGKSGVAGADISKQGGYGVSGTSVNGTGVYGTTAAISAAVEGNNTNATGGYGVSGTSENGIGVSGSSANGTGVAGSSQGNGYGVSGRSNSGTGVYGSTAGNDQTGVQGVDASTRGATGVSGTSTNGTGVSGTSSIGFGVYANSTGNGGIAVYGNDTSPGGGVGVYATSSTGLALDVFGEAGVTGNLAVNGTVSKGGGSFKIDHPLDPGGKYLYHSFVESPDMMNIYNGTVTLDRHGRAVVDLPDWFGALNRDYRYQLTPVGAPAPGLHIAAEVSGGQFAIGGGAPGRKVSWQITGIRQDAWANAHRIPVEETKPAEDRGRYLHPDLHGGQPVTSIARSRGRAEPHHSPAGQRAHNQPVGG